MHILRPLPRLLGCRAQWSGLMSSPVGSGAHSSLWAIGFNFVVLSVSSLPGLPPWVLWYLQTSFSSSDFLMAGSLFLLTGFLPWFQINALVPRRDFHIAYQTKRALSTSFLKYINPHLYSSLFLAGGMESIGPLEHLGHLLDLVVSGFAPLEAIITLAKLTSKPLTCGGCGWHQYSSL